MNSPRARFKGFCPPAPTDIKEARLNASLTQLQASVLIFVSHRVWQSWENGETAMHPAFFEFFKHKALTLEETKWKQ